MERPNKNDYLTTNQIEYNQLLCKYYDALEAYIDVLEKQLNIHSVVKPLPTKEDIISEGAKQVNDWLEGNTEREKQHYLIGFRRAYEYVLRRIK